MEKLNELLDLAKASHVIGVPVRLSDSQVEAIAEEFRAMEKRAEAAESGSSYMGGGARYWHDEYCAQQQRLVAKIVDLEAKLAELEKQESKPSYFLNRIESSDKWGPEVELRIYESQLDASKSKNDHGGGIIQLFTRLAPAVSLAELVPGEMETPSAKITYSRGVADGWNDCRAAILRKIEEKATEAPAVAPVKVPEEEDFDAV